VPLIVEQPAMDVGQERPTDDASLTTSEQLAECKAGLQSEIRIPNSEIEGIRNPNSEIEAAPATGEQPAASQPRFQSEIRNPKSRSSYRYSA